MGGNKRTQERETFRNLDRKEKMTYIWDFYRWHILCLCLAVVLIIALASTLSNLEEEPVFRGSLTNLTITQEGENYLTAELLAAFGMDAETEHIEFLHRTLENDVMKAEQYQAENSAVVALVMSKMVDLFIMDQESYDAYSTWNIFADVHRVLNAEQLAQVPDAMLKYIEDEDGNVYPVAIDISQTPFARDCLSGGGSVYLAFPGNTERNQMVSTFFDHLYSWNKENAA